MSNKYIVRQPIKDAQGKIWGHEILYHGENQAFAGDVASQNAKQHKGAAGFSELYDLHHHFADEENAPAV